MDSCFVDITLEFLAVAFNNILYYASVYTPSVFETRRKYSAVVYHCIHPEINQYIDLCLKTIGECLKSGQLNKVEFAVTDKEYTPIVKFVFDFERNMNFDETADAYLVQAEQNMRAFILILYTNRHKFSNLAEDSSFTIYIHTDESTAIAIATNPNTEDFPLIEVEDKYRDDKIIPLRRFAVRNFNLDTYIEVIQKEL